MENKNRLQQQFEFIIEIDKLKNIFRQSYISCDNRRENDAEHSWHISIMTFLLAEHSNKKDIDVLRILKMLLIHDIVEIDAGDTFVYDTQGYKDKKNRETKAAHRIFSLLSSDQKDEIFALWNEFEENKTAESHFANALDRVQPIMLNYLSEGKTWKKYNISYEQVLEKNKIIALGSETLWEYIQDIFKKSKEKGYLI